MVKQREEIALMMDNRTKEEGETSQQNKAREKFEYESLHHPPCL